jgi:phage/plasmid-like protein (TIGR03299 family)
MAAQIESMAHAGRMPWHGFSTPIQEEFAYDVDKAIQLAKVDWDVLTEPLYLAGEQCGFAPDGSPLYKLGAMAGTSAIVRNTDRRIVGEVGGGYVPLQNKKCFDWFRPILDARQARIESLGSLRGGSVIWALARLAGEPAMVAEGDEVIRYLLLSHSHDGSMSIRAGFTPVRVVCMNTLAFAHRSDASKLIRIRHSAQAESNLEAVRETMNMVMQSFEAGIEEFRRLASKHINQSDVRKYVAAVFEVADLATASTRMQNIVNKVCMLSAKGRGNELKSVRGTLWTAYNGITEYLSHDRGRSAACRQGSLWFGDAAKLSKRALELALAF